MGEPELEAVRSTVEREVLVSAYVALSYSAASSNVTRAVRWSGPYAEYDEGPTPAELEVAYDVLVDLAAGVSVEWALRRAGVS